MKKAIVSDGAPAAIGPYSQGILAGQWLYISGQLPLDPVGGGMGGSVEEQARQSLANIDAILSGAGFSRKDVVKTTVFLKNLDDFAAVNEIYGTFFAGAAFPARSTVQVAKLPKDAAIEIEAVACKAAAGNEPA